MKYRNRKQLYTSQNFKGVYRKLKRNDVSKPGDFINCVDNPVGEGWVRLLTGDAEVGKKVVSYNGYFHFYRRVHCKA